MKSFRLLVTLGLLAALAFSTVGVNAAKPLKVVMVPKFTGFAYFQSGKAGAELACKDLGVKDFSYTGTTTADIQGQVQVLQNLIPQKPDVVVAAIMDKDALLPVLKRLRQQGTIVITWDDDAAAGGQDLYCNMASYRAQGQAILENALDCNPDGRKVIWVSPSPTNSSFQGKIEGINWCIKNIDRYKDFQIIDTLYTNDDPEKGYSMALSAMKAHPDLSGFISGSGMTNPAMNKAIMDSGNTGKVYCTGFAIPDTMVEYVEKGVCKEYSLWSPKMLGYLATYVGIQVANKKLKLAEGKTLDIPRIGKRTIKKEDGRLVIDLNQMQFFSIDHTTYDTGVSMEEVLKAKGVKLVQ
jgi:ABC-type sugar transport system substrate-binding protein